MAAGAIANEAVDEVDQSNITSSDAGHGKSKFRQSKKQKLFLLLKI